MDYFLMIWIIIMCLDITLPFIISRWYKGYSHKRDLLSLLGSRQSPIKWIYNLWCIISGLVFCLVGFMIYQENRTGIFLSIYIFLFIYGLGCEIISGLFWLDEDINNQNVAYKIHGFGSALGFSLLVFTPLLLSIASFKEKDLVIGTISLISFIIELISFSFFIMGEKEKFRDTFLKHGGLWQRITLIFCYLPFIVWCLIII